MKTKTIKQEVGKMKVEDRIDDRTEYDYKNQAWIVDGKYVKCGHPDIMPCNCYGKKHEGEEATR